MPYFMTVTLVAQELNWSRSTVYRYIKEGYLETVDLPFARTPRVTRDALEDFKKRMSNGTVTVSNADASAAAATTAAGTGGM